MLYLYGAVFLIGVRGGMSLYKAYRKWFSVRDKEVAKVAVAIRREKNRRYAELFADVPDCTICGPSHRHNNILPN